MIENESHALKCFNACYSDGEGHPSRVGAGILRKLSYTTEAIGSGTHADIIRGIAEGYIAVNSVGPYMHINPFAAHTHMAMRYNHGELDWPREDFIVYCDNLIENVLTDVHGFVNGNLTALAQSVSRFATLNPSVGADGEMLCALDDAYLAMMVAKRYFDVSDEELEAAENEIFSQITDHVTLEG